MESTKFVDNDYRHSFMPSMEAMWKDSHYTDIGLKFQDTTIHCHKLILGTASPFFNAMFTSGLKESSSSEIEINDIEAGAAQSLIKYVYTGMLEITVNNVESLVPACELFQFNRLKKPCEDFMLQHVGPSNCIGFCKFAKLYSLEELVDKSRKYMMTHFRDVVLHSDEFTKLSPADLIEYISDDEIVVPNENIVFEAVKRWVKAAEEERTPSFTSIAEYIRFPFCTGDFLCYEVMEEPLMVGPECQKILQEARAYHMIPDQRPYFSTDRARPRLSSRCSLTLYVLGGILENNDCCTNIAFMHYGGKTLSELAQAGLKRPLEDLRFSSACATPKGILVTGGSDGTSVQDDCFFLTAESLKKESMGSMECARFRHQSVLHDHAVFVIGGEDEFCRPLSSVEKFDLHLETWSEVASMHQPLSNPLAVSCRRKIFVVSGVGENQAESLCTQEFDPDWDRWSFKAAMPQACQLGGATCLDDTIYVVGGFSRTCMSFQPLTDTWTVLDPPLKEHGCAPAVVWKGRIVVGGGKVGDDNEVTTLIEEFDPRKKCWSSWSQPMPWGVSSHHMLIGHFGYVQWLEKLNSCVFAD